MPPDVKGVRVLVVDDEPVVASAVCETLALSGMVCAYALNGTDAVACLDKEPDTDIVLLDVHLGPGPNGVELLTDIRREYKYVQVIMFTSLDFLELGVECMKRGAFDYMTKPFDEGLFLSKVPAALERKRTARVNDLYLSILVHDLKTPLQSIVGALDYFRDTLGSSFTDAHRRLLASADTGVARARTIVNNILAISLFENGAYKTKPEEFVVREAVDGVVGLFGGEYHRDGPGFHVDLAGTPVVCADKTLYSQVLANVVGNAVRFTPSQGTITIRCSDAAESVLDTGVTNTGSFIPEDLREAVFDKFAGVHFARDTLRGQNFGLGLTFSKMAVEAMGGRIWVEGERATPTTTFRFTVPTTDGSTRVRPQPAPSL